MGALTKDEAQKAKSGSRRAAYQEIVTHVDTAEAERNAEAQVDESDSEDEDEREDRGPSPALNSKKPEREGVALAVYKVS